MTYFPMGMGTIDSSHFNSTKFPGVCKPMDFETLDLFKKLQYQLNRVAQGMGIAKIGIDGDIGPATLKLANATGPWTASTPTCSALASAADIIAPLAEAKADIMGVPADIKTPATVTQPSIVTASGSVIAAPPAPPMGAGTSLAETFRNMSPTSMLLMGALAVGGFVYLQKSGKPRSSSRFTRRSRR